MSYTKGSVALATDYNALAGSTSVAASSSAAATAVAGYLYGVGYGDRGYGQTVPALSNESAGKVDIGGDWANLRTVISNIASWQNTAQTLLPPSGNMTSGAVQQAYPAGGSPYAIPDLLATLDTNRLNYQTGNMTLTLASTNTRATTWGISGGSITGQFLVTFASEDAARAFFNTGGEIRIGMAHPNTSTTRDADWNAVLSGFSLAFRAHTSVMLGGSYGTAVALGYYNLTTSDQVICSLTSGFISPYSTNTFYLYAHSASITGANGGKGYQLIFSVVLNDTYYTGIGNDNLGVQAGTNATLSHYRATSSFTIAAPTVTIFTNF